MYCVTIIANGFIADFENKIVEEFNKILNSKINYSFEKSDDLIFIKFWINEDQNIQESQLKNIEIEYDCSVFVISREILEIISDPSIPKVAVFDLDSTLIQMEVIDTLAKCKPEISEEVARITEESMKGIIDFKESLKRRVALLEGILIEKEWDHIKNTVKFTKGAKELFKNILNKENGWTTALISGGFLPIAEWVKDHLNLSFAYANELETEESELVIRLTGRLQPGRAIIDSQAKEHHLLRLIDENKALVSVAVGDGANDLLMLSQATFGVAYNAKPVVQAAAKFRLNNPNIYSLYHVLKYEYKKK